MTGYVRKDTTNNIADGNVINAADLDAEFDGVQDAFNASTGHNHDGTSGEGAPITALGPTQDVTISATLLAPKTTNTVDIGSSALKFKDLFLAGNGSIGGTLAVTGVATLTAQPILSSLTASRAVFTDGSKGLVSNAITGTGNVVMSASPTLTGTVAGASLTLSSLTSGRVTFAGASGLLTDDADLTFDGTTLSTAGLTASGTVTLSGGTANGVAYLNGSKVVTSGSALTFDGTTLGVTSTAATSGDINSTNANGSAFVFKNSGTAVGWVGNGSSSFVGASASNFGINGQSNLLFGVSGYEVGRFTSTGLGIGTSSPAAKVHSSLSSSGATSETLRLDNPSDSANAGTKLVYRISGWSFDGGFASLTRDGSGGGTIMAFGTSANASTTNASEKLRIDSAGNVGIGTSSPSAALTVGTTSAGKNIAIYSSSNGNNGLLRMYDQGNTERLQIGVNSTGEAAYFTPTGSVQAWYINTEQMRLTSTGLGIGTSSPASALDVKAANAGQGIRLTSTTGTNGVSYKASNSAGNVYFGIDTSTGGTFGNANNAVIWYDAAYPLIFATNNSKQMTLDSSGNLGLGVTPSASAGAKAINVGSIGYVFGDGATYKYNAGITSNAYVNGNGTFAAIQSRGAGVFEIDDDSFKWRQASSGTAGSTLSLTQAMTLDASGNLGVGTTSPSSFGKLAVNGNIVTTTDNVFIGVNDGSDNKLSLVKKAGGFPCIASASSAPIIFSQSSAASIVSASAETYTERARIDSSGNLLVGTTSATYGGQLTVKSAGQTSLSLQNSNFVAASAGTQLNSYFGATTGNTYAALQVNSGGGLAYNDLVLQPNGGNVLVGTTSQVAAGFVSVLFNGATSQGIALGLTANTSDATYALFRDNSGNTCGLIQRVGTTSAVLYTTTSDYRLKTVVGAVTGHGARIDALEPIEYTWNSNGLRSRGFLAHKFQEVYANSVNGTKDAVDADGNPKYQAMQAATSEVIADLVAEIQSLRKRLADAGI